MMDWVGMLFEEHVDVEFMEKDKYFLVPKCTVLDKKLKLELPTAL